MFVVGNLRILPQSTYLLPLPRSDMSNFGSMTTGVIAIVSTPPLIPISSGHTGCVLEYVAVIRQPVLCTLVGTYVGINVPDHAYGVLGWAQYIGCLDQLQQSSVWEIN